MKKARHDVSPQEALNLGLYLYSSRRKRSDAKDEECLDLARQYWHNDDISRATGNSGKY